MEAKRQLKYTVSMKHIRRKSNYVDDEHVDYVTVFCLNNTI